MNLELRPLGKSNPCDVDKCSYMHKCLLHGSTKEGVEKTFRPLLDPGFVGGDGPTITCRDYEPTSPSNDEAEQKEDTRTSGTDE
jgi:hypothetical protein